MKAEQIPKPLYGQAAHVVRKCGGIQSTARLIGRHPSWVLKWTYAKERGGRGGLIPDEDQQILMQAAREGRADLCPSDFFPPETRNETAD